MTSVTKSVMFFGRVQGINFRRNVFRKAVELGVKGWIANQPDGSVTGLFSGPEISVEKLFRYCLSEIPLARIDRHEISDAKDEGFDSFRIL